MFAYMEKIKFFRESLRLVWKSAPGWTFLNIVILITRLVGGDANQ